MSFATAQRQPMKRTAFMAKGSGFKAKEGQFSSFKPKAKAKESREHDQDKPRSSFKPRQPVGTERERAPAPALKPLAKPANYARIDASTPAQAVAKDPRQKMPRLLALSKGEPCMLQVPTVGVHDPATSVACHANWKAYGKGGMKKAHDFFSVSGCYSCHTWLDQGGTAPDAEKQAIFEAAMLRQIERWRWMLSQLSIKPEKREAAQWALDGLAGNKLGAEFLAGAGDLLP